MSCNTCTKPFNLLRREKGCPSCGFSYCSKCLDNKIFIQKLNCEAKVCVKCKQSTSKEDYNLPPPDAYIKRVEKLKNSEIQEKLNKLKESDDQKPQKSSDQQIVERLKNLKGDTVTASDDEIRERLAKLRGVPTSTLKSQNISLNVGKSKTEQEQIDELMEQYLKETKIDSNYTEEFDNSVINIEERLQKLKSSKTSNEENKHGKIPDEEESVEKIIEKYKAEAALDISEIEEKQTEINEELPFCEICNEDATLRCLGCQYLFCKRCFLDHKDDDDGCNRYEPYQPPKINRSS